MYNEGIDGDFNKFHSKECGRPQQKKRKHSMKNCSCSQDHYIHHGGCTHDDEQLNWKPEYHSGRKHNWGCNHRHHHDYEDNCGCKHHHDHDDDCGCKPHHHKHHGCSHCQHHHCSCHLHLNLSGLKDNLNYKLLRNHQCPIEIGTIGRRKFMGKTKHVGIDFVDIERNGQMTTILKDKMEYIKWLKER